MTVARRLTGILGLMLPAALLLVLAWAIAPEPRDGARADAAASAARRAFLGQVTPSIAGDMRIGGGLGVRRGRS
jgi:hypothetical protein